MTATTPRYSPLDLLLGRWLILEERPGITLFRLAPSHRRARIAGVAVVLTFYWTLRELRPELGSWAFLFVLAAMWLLLAKWNRGPVAIGIVENEEVALAQIGNLIPRETIWMNQVRELEVRENLWKNRGVIPLCQLYLHRNGSAEPVLIYQQWRTRRHRVLEVATRLADRWQARLTVDDDS